MPPHRKPRAGAGLPRLLRPRGPLSRALAVIGAAFGAGLLLFLLVWWGGRKEDLHHAEPVVVAPDAADLAPLPQPQADGEPASDMPEPGEARADPPRVAESPAPQPPAPASPAADERTTASRAPQGGASLAPGDRPVPIEGRSPPPRYPAAALRAGRSGTVTVRVDVDAQGRPAGVTVVGRSGSRDLDRAAAEALRRWRFHPAQRDGRAVPASLVVPVTFDFEG